MIYGRATRHTHAASVPPGRHSSQHWKMNSSGNFERLVSVRCIIILVVVVGIRWWWLVLLVLRLYRACPASRRDGTIDPLESHRPNITQLSAEPPTHRTSIAKARSTRTPAGAVDAYPVVLVVAEAGGFRWKRSEHAWVRGEQKGEHIPGIQELPKWIWGLCRFPEELLLCPVEKRVDGALRGGLYRGCYGGLFRVERYFVEGWGSAAIIPVAFSFADLCRKW